MARFIQSRRLNFNGCAGGMAVVESYALLPDKFVVLHSMRCAPQHDKRVIGEAGPFWHGSRMQVLRKYHSMLVETGSNRIGTDIVQHLSGWLGSKVTVTLEINGEIPSGASDNVVRTVVEYCRTLKFERAFGVELRTTRR